MIMHSSGQLIDDAHCDYDWKNMLCCRAPARRSVGSIRMNNQPHLTNHSQHSYTNGASGNNNSQQWAPEFPSQAQEKTHSKFVPMQFRTQPANLPGGMRRQSTHVTMQEARGEWERGVRVTSCMHSTFGQFWYFIFPFFHFLYIFEHGVYYECQNTVVTAIINCRSFRNNVFRLWCN